MGGRRRGAHGGADAVDRRELPHDALDELPALELRLDGDAMEPTLRHGDRVLVDMGSRRPQQKDGIYLLRTAGGLQAKRVAANPLTGLVTVISDNREHYPCFSDLQPDDITVVGRVTWLGRQVGA